MGGWLRARTKRRAGGRARRIARYNADKYFCAKRRQWMARNVKTVKLMFGAEDSGAAEDRGGPADTSRAQMERSNRFWKLLCGEPGPAEAAEAARLLDSGFEEKAPEIIGQMMIGQRSAAAWVERLSQVRAQLGRGRQTWEAILARAGQAASKGLPEGDWTQADLEIYAALGKQESVKIRDLAKGLMSMACKRPEQAGLCGRYAFLATGRGCFSAVGRAEAKGRQALVRDWAKGCAQAMSQKDLGSALRSLCADWGWQQHSSAADRGWFGEEFPDSLRIAALEALLESGAPARECDEMGRAPLRLVNLCARDEEDARAFFEKLVEAGAKACDLQEQAGPVDLARPGLKGLVQAALDREALETAPGLGAGFSGKSAKRGAKRSI